MSFSLDTEELLKKIRRLEQGREVRALIRQSLRKAAAPVLVTARQIAPVDTGALRRSLKIRSAKRSRRRIAVVIRPGSRSELGIPSGAVGYYPAHQELGTEDIEETRYLRDAVELEKEDAIGILGDEISEGLERIARRA